MLTLFLFGLWGGVGGGVVPPALPDVLQIFDEALSVPKVTNEEVVD